MSRPRTRFLLFQMLVGAALLVAWLWVVDLTEFGLVLSRAKWLLILLAAIVGLGSSLLRAWRWRILIRPIALVPLAELWMIGNAAVLVNFLIPLRTAEVARSLLLRGRRRIPVSASLPTVVADRAFDLFVVQAIGAAGALFGVRLNQTLQVIMLTGGTLFLAFVVFVALAVMAERRLVGWVDRVLPKRMKPSWRRSILEVLEQALLVFNAVGRRPKDLPPMFALTLGAALLDASLIFLLFTSLNAVVPASIILTGYALFTMAFLIPAAPGHVGSMEAFGSLVFVSLGVSPELAACTAVLNHIVTAVMLGGLGAWAMLALGTGPRSIVPADTELESVV